MEHLRLAIGFMAFLSIGVFFFTRRLLQNSSRMFLDQMAIIVIVLIGAYIYLVWGQLWIVNWIPLPSVIILSNWFPIFLAMLAAILWNRHQNLTMARRLPMQLALCGAAVWSIMSAIPREPPQCGNEWIEAEPPVPYRICRQTTKDTCSAAAVATILEALGVAATEAEMARLCLTNKGTTWLGMYHGLSIKLWGTGYRASFFEGTADEMARLAAVRPVLLCCQLTEEVAQARPVYREQEGWIVGAQHSVVCFGEFNNHFLIGDPSQLHMEHWTREHMNHLWTGTGLTVTAAQSE